MLRPFASALFLLAASACTDVPTKPDGGAGVGTLEIGTGSTAFMPLTDGAPVEVVRGPQGGWHIWVAVRSVEGLNPSRLELRLRVLEGPGADAKELSLTAYRVTLVKNGAYFEWYALQGLLPSPVGATPRELWLRVDATDVDGKTATDMRRVMASGP